VLVAPDGVAESWLASPMSQRDARDRLGLDPTRRIAVYTGRFQPGTAPLLRGVAERLRGQVDVIAVGIGASEARGTVPVTDGLAILDPVSTTTVRLYQAAADVLVMPHTGEVRWSRYTSPLKLFEYMAARRPIVASHLPVLDEVIRHGETAWLVPLGDPDAMARGILDVLGDGVLSARLVEQAGEAVRHYTWQARARTIVGFVRSIDGAP
jgi:glycosyltransferase involved in cell wall biosynthesis